MHSAARLARLSSTPTACSTAQQDACKTAVQHWPARTMLPNVPTSLVRQHSRMHARQQCSTGRPSLTMLPSTLAA